MRATLAARRRRACDGSTGSNGASQAIIDARELGAAMVTHGVSETALDARHFDYCMINPVKQGLVRRVQDWPYSSFHRDVGRGIFPIYWAGDVDSDGEFGEA